MEIAEARNLKGKLEAEIRASVVSFERATGLYIDRINILRCDGATPPILANDTVVAEVWLL